jgi:pimeloyl-ACP methyl ester carboxylesterase
MRSILSGFWRAGVLVAEKVNPRLGGRMATRQFLYTRGYGKMRTEGAPLGASIVQIPGNRGVSKAFVWGSQGPLAFLVHGWGGDSGSMCSLVKPLKNMGYRVVAFDAPAHGTNPGNRTTMRDFVASVAYMIDHFEPEREIGAIVGHSLGGLAVVAALSRTRRRPAKLVFVASPSCLNDSLLYYMKTWGFSQGIGEEIRKELDRSHGVPIEHWDVQTLGFAPDMPTLVIHDELDALVSSKQADIIAENLGPSTKVMKTRGLGHIRILADENTREMICRFIGRGENEENEAKIIDKKLTRSEACS